jgi:F0F1-type ATP synthase membrane subunit b/b'
MQWNFLSFFVNHEEPFFQLNTNIFETNVINILILLGVLLYANKVSFSKTLADRQLEIITIIENAQKDVVTASTYYYQAEKGFTQSLFWLQSWKVFYESEKIDLVTKKYNFVKKGLQETFDATEILIQNFEKKAFITLQRYVIYVTVSKILRKFFLLSATEQSKLIEVTITKLGGFKK